MSKRNAGQKATATKTLVPANLPPEHSPWAVPGQVLDPARCPVDHARHGLAPDYLSAAPADPSHLPDGTMNYEGFFRHRLHDLHMQGNYRVFRDLERHAGNFPRATHLDDHG